MYKCSFLISAFIIGFIASAGIANAQVRPATGPNFVQISMNLNLARRAGELGANDLKPTAQSEVMRKALYESAARECASLLETIASSCQLTNLNVSTNEQAYPNQPPMVNVSMNATYSIALKQS
jgi:hypothetical protein